MATKHAPTDALSSEAFLTAPSLALPGLRHGFFTRRGGHSDGLYESLNVGIGSKDERDTVERNRARAAATLGVEARRLATPYQVHSPDVAIIDAPFPEPKPQVDAVVTATPGLAVGIVTADCGPVLFADPEARIVGAAHAGWKGAVGGVLDTTVKAMEHVGAKRERIRAVLGPAIMAESYEVGADMRETATRADPEAEAFFLPGQSAGKRQFDLPGYILARLRRFGVEAEFVGACTYAQEDRFFSFRRTTHRGEPDYGRQLSAIVIEDQT